MSRKSNPEELVHSNINLLKNNDEIISSDNSRVMNEFSSKNKIYSSLTFIIF